MSSLDDDDDDFDDSGCCDSDEEVHDEEYDDDIDFKDIISIKRHNINKNSNINTIIIVNYFQNLKEL